MHECVVRLDVSTSRFKTKSVYVLAESRLSELYDVDAKVRTAAMFENVRALPVA